MPATPTASQLAWQRGEMYMFVHFGINTFTDNEWGNGTENPAWFNPSRLDARQWATVAQEAGFSGIIFTAKHHEGFALWPTQYSDFSVKHSSWEQGAGDVVKAVAEACREAGLKFGIYLSPWDRHEPTYGTPAYDDFYINQLTELLTNYGPIFEVWIDGAHGEGGISNYDYPRIYQTAKTLQPDVLIAISGRDIRWVGNEIGVAPETQWSVEETTWWYPAECDVPNRPGWFWHDYEDDEVKSLKDHLSIYFSSVGNNCVLLLNVPPNREGLLPEPDVARLKEFRAALDAIFNENLAQHASVKASEVRADCIGWSAQNVLDGKTETFWATNEGATQGWLEVDMGEPVLINIVELQEPIQYGQRVASFRLEAWISNQWKIIARGTTIGYKKLARTATIKTRRVRLVIESAKASPAIQTVGLYYAPHL
ncbi:MAG TPA: alpha-L-fucosidase [Rhodothermales bacterium]|nr:alpha-L-fucosidase [Rhodothermales bacterium]